MSYLTIGAEEAAAEGAAAEPVSLSALVELQKRSAAQLAELLAAQKRDEKLRMITTGAAVVGVVVGLVRLGDILATVRRRRRGEE